MADNFAGDMARSAADWVRNPRKQAEKAKEGAKSMVADAGGAAYRAITQSSGAAARREKAAGLGGDGTNSEPGQSGSSVEAYNRRKQLEDM
jgi:hypothetical protein